LKTTRFAPTSHAFSARQVVDARVTAEGVELPTLSAETPTEQSRNVHACIAIWKAMNGGVEGVEVRDN